MYYARHRFGMRTSCFVVKTFNISTNNSYIENNKGLVCGQNITHNHFNFFKEDYYV